MRFKIRIATSTAAAALLCACLLAAPSGASAQQTAQPMTSTPAAPTQAAPAKPAMAAPAATRAADKGNRSDRVEARIKSLHAQLKITSDEEQQWDAVAQTMRDNARDIDELVQDRNKQIGHMNAIDDMKSYQKITQAHADEMQKLVPAFQALYDKMPDPQKKRADTVFNQRTAQRQGVAPKKG